LICLPIVAIDREGVLRQAAAVVECEPDLIEWRVDKFEALKTPQKAMQTLEAMRAAIGDIPLIFTCRSPGEGGFQSLDADMRLQLNLAAIASGRVDIVDTELSGGEAMIGTMRDSCRHSGVKLILSYHNFESTPDEAFILDRLATAQRLGADIAKVAVMSQNPMDVLTLLSATCKARRGEVATPIVSMAMGEVGAVTRVAGALFGSDVTFAIGRESSAPGQIPVADLRASWRALGLR